MAWTTPRTWVSLELVTASIMNTHVRDNLSDLDANRSIFAGLIRRNGSISPAPGSDQNDYSPSGWTNCNRMYLNPTVALVQITGFAALAAGSEIIFWNINTGANVVKLRHANGSSSAGNRINTPTAADIDFGPNQGGFLSYNDNQARWNLYRCV